MSQIGDLARVVVDHAIGYEMTVSQATDLMVDILDALEIDMFDDEHGEADRNVLASVFRASYRDGPWPFDQYGRLIIKNAETNNR